MQIENENNVICSRKEKIDNIVIGLARWMAQEQWAKRRKN